LLVVKLESELINEIMNNIFHDGQLAVQKITGEEEIAKKRLPMIEDSIHSRAIPFIEHQILAFPGSEDSNGNLWLSLLVGKRGFIKIPSVQEIKFDLSRVTSNQDDIFFKNIETKPTVGLLFHEADRRARYRAWGVARKEGDQLSFDIRMGYPSCPKHIQREVIKLSPDSKVVTATYEKSTTLGKEEKEWIANAHTFFIATQTKKGDIESSHRGGNPVLLKFWKMVIYVYQII